MLCTSSAARNGSKRPFVDEFVDEEEAMTSKNRGMKSLFRLMMTVMVGAFASVYAVSASENRMEPRGWRDDRNTIDIVRVEI